MNTNSVDITAVPVNLTTALALVVDKTYLFQVTGNQAVRLTEQDGADRTKAMYFEPSEKFLLKVSAVNIPWAWVDGDGASVLTASLSAIQR